MNTPGFLCVRSTRVALAIGFCFVFFLVPHVTWTAEPSSVTVHLEEPGHEVSPSLWGIFFEDINCSADGGIYAELVRNRSLEDSDKPEHWSLVTTGPGKGEVAVCTDEPLGGDPVAKRNRRSLRLRIQEAGGDGTVGVANDGYWGVAVREGALKTPGAWA